jgi:pimeloyl-ACP methyl ester carboxylesterase
MAYFSYEGDDIFFFQKPGIGIPLILLHGLAASSLQIDKLMVGWSGAPLISLDFPGHGNSLFPNHQKSVSFDYYGETVVALMEELSIPRAVIGGISMGSGVSQNIALRFPDKVSGLVLIRPAWLDQLVPKNLRIVLDGADYLGMPDGIEKFKQRDDFIAISRTLPNAAKSGLGIFDKSQQSNLHQVLRQMVNDKPVSELSKLKEVQVPVCIIANEDDPLHPFKLAEKLSHFFPFCELKKVASRYINDEIHRSQVVNIISESLNRI